MCEYAGTAIAQSRRRNVCCTAQLSDGQLPGIGKSHNKRKFPNRIIEFCRDPPRLIDKKANRNNNG